ncbi:MAG: hypothetical protein U5K54_13780 [Cytophagales bacterium]|nr:hypothetical protein [Cytophagales bacterium]
MKNGKPAFGYNYLGLNSTEIIANQSVKPGKHTIVYNFAYEGGGPGKGGIGTLTVDGTKVAEGRLEKTQAGIFSVDDLADVGMDEGTWIMNYGTSDKFSGNIYKVTIEREEEKK